MMRSNVPGLAAALLATSLLATACTVASGTPPPQGPPPTYVAYDDQQPPEGPPPEGPPPRDDRPHGHRPPPPPPQEVVVVSEPTRPPRGDSSSQWNAGWRMQSEKTLALETDQAQVDFSQKQGVANQLVIAVLDSDVQLLELSIVFTSGKTYKPTNLLTAYRAGSHTQPIDLPNADILRAVQYKFKNTTPGGRARVQIWVK